MLYFGIVLYPTVAVEAIPVHTPLPSPVSNPDRPDRWFCCHKDKLQGLTQGLSVYNYT